MNVLRRCLFSYSLFNKAIKSVLMAVSIRDHLWSVNFILSVVANIKLANDIYFTVDVQLCEPVLVCRKHNAQV